MGSINWSGFDWQAFSTLATGLAAVIGATIVGFRQTMISKRQNEILERQTELEELKLKSELYDRRIEVYRETEQYLRSLKSSDFKARIDAIRFRATITKSRFLFRSSVTNELLGISQVSLRQRELIESLERLESEEFSSPERDERKAELTAKIRSEGRYLDKCADNLPAIFGHELELGSIEENPNLDAYFVI